MSVSNDDDGLQEASFISAIAPDPHNVPDSVVVVGYLGRSTTSGRWRLYLNPDLSTFVEFDRSDVLHTEVLASSSEESERTRVWITPAALAGGPGDTRRAASTSFLEGEIAQAYMDAGRRVQQLHAVVAFGMNGTKYADPTLFQGSTCALSSCVSDVAICTNSGQTTCDPGLCFPAPKAYFG